MPRQVLPQQGSPIPHLGIQIKKLGGMWPERFLPSLSSLFKDLDCPRSTRLHVLLLFPGLGA